MKNLLVTALTLSLLFRVAAAQTPGDSTEYFPPSEYASFKETYNAHAAYVDGDQWTTSLGNQRLGRRWRNVAGEFEVSPEGKTAYLLAQRQKGQAPMYVIEGYALTLGSLPLLVSGAGSPGNNLEGGIGIGMLAGGFVLNFVGSKKLAASEDNFSKALWLRNRDEMLQYVSPIDQPRFRYLYETETLYLASKAYYKNGNKYPFGFWGTSNPEEFRNTPASWGLYKKYRTNQWAGILVQGAGLAAAALSLDLYTSKGQLLYIGGFALIGAGIEISLSGRKYLNQAVYLRNYTVMERQMLRQ